ncbi:MAG TPA: FAD binding domain-containing protein [Burkholderiales bacterium]|nr:FAD binding domain-containing protein [Burkholderiales bacterium]
MKPAPFEYHAPRTLKEALDVLARVAPRDGRVLAGGQSLVPAMALRLARPAHLVDINGVKDLERLAVEAKELVIGACVRHAAFHRPVVNGPLGQLLSEVARHIAHFPIRTRGTLCGSLAHADPASEWCLVAATLDARMIARSVRGGRTIAAADFFRGAMTTALEADELLAEARIPLLARDARWGFSEFSRRAGDFAVAMALASYRLRDGVMAGPRVGIGGVEDAPRRIAQAEAVLEGKRPGKEAFIAAADAVARAVSPPDDARNPARYRCEVAAAMARRALERAAA